MKKLFLLVILAIIMFSCKSNRSESSEPNDSLTVFKLNFDNALDSAEKYIDRTIEVQGMVTHVCKHGGKRLHLTGSNPDKKIVAITGDKIDYFDATIEGKDVLLKGFMRETRIDEDYLNEWEQEIIAAGEDTTSHEDKTHAADHQSPIDKINTLRNEIKTSEKGYISDFWIECNEIKVLD